MGPPARLADPVLLLVVVVVILTPIIQPCFTLLPLLTPWPPHHRHLPLSARFFLPAPLARTMPASMPSCRAVASLWHCFWAIPLPSGGKKGRGGGIHGSGSVRCLGDSEAASPCRAGLDG